MDMKQILEYVEEKITTEKLTIVEVERAVDREEKLKNSNRSKRTTKRVKYEEEIKEMIESCIKYDDVYKYDLEKKTKEIMPYIEKNLSNTTLWRMKTNIIKWLNKNYKQYMHQICEIVPLNRHYRHMYRS